MLSDEDEPVPTPKTETGLNAPSGAGCFLTLEMGSVSSSWTCLNAPSGAGCFLTGSGSTPETPRPGLNAPSGAGCFLTLRLGCTWRGSRSLNAPSGAGCFLTPASGNGVVAPLPGAGAPPAPRAPRGTGQHRPYLTTFRRADAKRRRRPLRCLQPPTSDQGVGKVDGRLSDL